MLRMKEAELAISHDGATSAVPLERVLGRMASSFVEKLPMGLREMQASLASDGCPLECTALKDLVSYYQARGARAPFHIVRFGGMELAVAPNQTRVAAQVGAAAVRMVQHWGIVGAKTLAERAEVVSGGPVPIELVSKILGALPATRWLDGSARQWFSFAQRSNGLGDALDKVLSLNRKIPVTELRQALAKSYPSLVDAPESVFERYLADVAGWSVEEGRPQDHAGRADALTKPETILVGILTAVGGQVGPAALRRQAAAAGLSDATLTRLLRFSPLVMRTPSDDVRLLGEAQDDTRITEASRRPAPASRVQLAS